MKKYCTKQIIISIGGKMFKLKNINKVSVDDKTEENLPYTDSNVYIRKASTFLIQGKLHKIRDYCITCKFSHSLRPHQCIYFK